MELQAFHTQVLVLAGILRRRGWRIATAESCTGGLIAAACTQLAGSSDWFERGFVTYSNEAKTQLLGVPEALIASHCAVSEETVRAMHAGALRAAPVQLAAAVTGIAGPGGGTPGKWATRWPWSSCPWRWRWACDRTMNNREPKELRWKTTRT